ncbi:MAG: YaiO family outer membrane beta-barrel protein [Gemmatimonadaceae bacterium]|nr:YaiO family outer membrane beta-barrel protein [Gemmatimonadaceae bacterium]
MRSRWWALTASWIISVGLAAGPGVAQEPGQADVAVQGRPLSGWTAEATIGRDSYLSDASTWRPWSAAELLVARRFDWGSIGVGAVEVKRFDRRDGARSLDIYGRLWPGAFGNLRGAVATTAVVLPTTDLSAELFQGVQGGWEPSVAIRRMGYGNPVFLSSLSVGKYVGDRWYGRVRGTQAERGGGGGGSSVSGLVRRYVGPSREFVEMAAGTGEEAVTAGVTTSNEVVVDIRQTGFLEVGGRKYLTRLLGASVSLGYHTFEAIPDRLGLRVGALARF